MLSVVVGTPIELLAFLFIKNLHSKQLSSIIPFPVPSKNDTDSAPGLLYCDKINLKHFPTRLVSFACYGSLILSCTMTKDDMPAKTILNDFKEVT